MFSKTLLTRQSNRAFNTITKKARFKMKRAFFVIYPTCHSEHSKESYTLCLSRLQDSLLYSELQK
jgi:hypothetical protein